MAVNVKSQVIYFGAVNGKKARVERMKYMATGVYVATAAKTTTTTTAVTRSDSKWYTAWSSSVGIGWHRRTFGDDIKATYTRDKEIRIGESKGEERQRNREFVMERETEIREEVLDCEFS
ncbi:unnamed protein product [Enterobius vermicularis]|uniref:Uncharacterized protein n=1 Tax=Enterobius vermicularis TaxID=51028 RepID=A0A0N4V3M3_ENTVE|nr:unnamed protein product [Enterobius vermicularis]